MSYCRFENTAKDLEDCFENWELSEDAFVYEKEGKKRIIELAKDILEDEGFEVSKI
jgi:hypothetical protein